MLRIAAIAFLGFVLLGTISCNSNRTSTSQYPAGWPLSFLTVPVDSRPSSTRGLGLIDPNVNDADASAAFDFGSYHAYGAGFKSSASWEEIRRHFGGQLQSHDFVVVEQSDYVYALQSSDKSIDVRIVQDTTHRDLYTLIVYVNR